MVETRPVQPRATLAATSVSPNAAPAGTTVVISGVGFDTAAGTVTMQDRTASWGYVAMPATVVSDTELAGVLPPLPEGVAIPQLVDVYVWDNASGASVINGGLVYLEPPPPPTTWPTDADLADRLGLAAGDDTGRVSAANDAAMADAVAVAGLDPAAGPDDAGQVEAVLLLGQWWYENRNRPEGLDSLNPMASPYYRRVAIGILQRGKLPVA